jgi:signal transduction histidine kinase
MALGVRGWVVVLIVIALLPGLLTTLFLLAEVRATQLQEAGAIIDRAIETRVAHQQGQIEVTERFLVTLSAVEALQDRGGSECPRFLRDATALSDVYHDIAVIEPDGTVRCAANTWSDGVPERVDQLAERAARVESIVTGDYRVDAATRRAAIDMAYPVREADGTLDFVLYADVNLIALAQEGRLLTSYPGSLFLVVDAEGTILMHEPHPDLPVGITATDDPLVQTITEAEEGRTTARGPDGRLRIYSFARLPGDNEARAAYLAYGLPVEAVTALPEEDFRGAIILTLIGAIIVFAVAWQLSQSRLVAPILLMTGIAERLAAGELDARTNLGADRGELGRLASTLDQLAASFQNFDRARTDLMNNTAHQLRTPLTAIQTAAYTLGAATEPENGPAQRAAEIIQRNTIRLKENIDSVLAVTQFQTGDQMLLSPVDLAAIAQEAAAAHKEDAGKGGVHFEVEAKGPLIIDGNPEWLRTAIHAYLENALRVTPAGGTVRMRVQREDDEAHLTVTDSGRGFEPKDHARLFEPFGHTLAAERETDAGIGLGLYLVRLILRRHGGRVYAKSDGAGKGSTFGFGLPLRDP